MELTKEMAEMLERTMEQYFAAWWQKNATPEQEAKRVAEGKTFKGAYHFAHTVAEKYRNRLNGEKCVAMPDELAYWILAHYMESEKEGAEYRTPEEIEAERKREVEKAEARRKKAEEEAEKMNEGSLIKVSAEEVLAAEARAEAARAEAKAVKATVRAEVAKSAAVSEKMEQMSLL